MEEQLITFVEFAQGQPLWLGILLLFGASCIEYIFPPFPGDTVTLAGAVLIPLADWPWYLVFMATIAGSLLGAGVNWWLGRWVDTHRERETWVHRWLERENVAPRVERLMERFREHGAVYISLNRFVPAFRSLFFIAAGLAGLSIRKVMFFGALSAALWNAAILGVGYTVGYNLEKLATVGETYQRTVLGVLIGGVVLWGILQYVRGRREDPVDREET